MHAYCSSVWRTSKSASRRWALRPRGLGAADADDARAVGEDDVELEDLGVAVALDVHGDVLEIDRLVAGQDGQQLLLKLRQVVGRLAPARVLARHDDRQAIPGQRGRL